MGKYSEEEIKEAFEYAKSIPMSHAPGIFSGMTDDEVKRHKMKHRYGIDISADSSGQSDESALSN